MRDERMRKAAEAAVARWYNARAAEDPYNAPTVRMVASKFNLATTPAWQLLKKLEKSGMIAGRRKRSRKAQSEKETER